MPVFPEHGVPAGPQLDQERVPLLASPGWPARRGMPDSRFPSFHSLPRSFQYRRGSLGALRTDLELGIVRDPVDGTANNQKLRRVYSPAQPLRDAD